jgi:hypothetical protein
LTCNGILGFTSQKIVLTVVRAGRTSDPSFCCDALTLPDCGLQLRFASTHLTLTSVRSHDLVCLAARKLAKLKN